MKFSDLGLGDKVLSAVEAQGYETPTPIQAEAIPHVLQRRDVLGIAQTGTGKTASFTLPMLSLLEKGRARARMPRTIILEPTRELAAQVEENFINYGVNHKINVSLLIGGVSIEEQIKKLDRGADVLIATPGRLIDLIDRGRILLQAVEIVVIDEADRMLDMGFIPDIERILKMIPFTRQTLLFSATMPPVIKKLADQFLQNPVQVQVAATSSASKTITQRLVAVGKKDYEQRAKLRELINGCDDLKNAIIFCNRKRDVADLYKSLQRHEYSVGALHGDMDQHSRSKMLQGFRDGNISIMVASDVAARGLDIPDVSHVFNFDVPTHAEDYVHRIGRTGRAGREGTAFTFVRPREKDLVADIEKLIDEKIEWLDGAAAQSNEDGDKKPTRGRKRNTDKKQTTENKKTAKTTAKSKDKSESDAHLHSETAAQTRAPAPRQKRSSNKNAQAGFGDHVPDFLLRSTKD
jgi:superfamily II DNA/RNA helicase